MTISVRIVHLDYYMTEPGPLDRSHSPFHEKKLSKVPVIRIFGSTAAGQKICVHVHQVYPYFYVPYSIPLNYTTNEEIQRDIYQFGTSLNEAMNLANNSEQDQYIAAIVLTKGVPFYGYHVGHTSFLKIYLINPYKKQQMLDILQTTTAIQNTSFQPFEAHLNFELQFLMDYNLYGMDWIHIDDRHGVLTGSESFGIRFRLPLCNEPRASIHITQSFSFNSDDTSYSNMDIYTSKTIPLQLQSDKLPRESYCELELDITCMSILNRLDLNERDIHTTMDSEIKYNLHQEPHAEKLVKSLDAIWKDELKRRKARGLSDPSIPPVSQIIDRNPSNDPWTNEPSFRHILEKYMLSDIPAQNEPDKSPLMLNILTTFQSVQALYPDAYFLLDNDENSPQEVVSNLFNVTATPSRYQVWDLPSQLDRSILESFIEDLSFNNEQEKIDLVQEEEEEVEEEEDFSDEDGLRNSDLARWLEQTEKKPIKRNNIAIEYEEQTFQPRQLNFIAETQKIDTILQADTDNLTKKDIFEKEEEEEEPFQISDVPPESMLKMRKRNKKRPPIDQVDGGNDPKEPKKQKTAEERWEEERNMLRRMRLKKMTDKKSRKLERSASVPPATTIKSTDMRRINSNTIETDKDHLQKVAVVIKTNNKRTFDAQNIWNINSTLPSSKKPHISLDKHKKLSTSNHLDHFSSTFTSNLNKSVNIFTPSPDPDDITISPTIQDVEARIIPSSLVAGDPINDNSSLSVLDEPEAIQPSFSKSPVISKNQTIYSISDDDESFTNYDFNLDSTISIKGSNVAESSRKQDMVYQSTETKEYIYKHPPPIITEIPNIGVKYQEPYYSKASDVPRYPAVIGGKVFKLSTKGLDALPEFKTRFHVDDGSKTQIKTWTLAQPPPSVQEIKEWMKSDEFKQTKKRKATSQLINPTADNSFGFKFSASKPQVKGKTIRNYLDFFSLELHVNTRDSLLPDPEHDPVQLIFWCLQTKYLNIPSNGYQEGYHVGVIVIKDAIHVQKIGLSNRRLEVDYAENEQDLFHILIDKVRFYDPDMLVGYEVQGASWGYLVDRGAQIGLHLLDELSRFKMTSETIRRDQWGYRKASMYKVVGRHMLNVWRLMRHELSLINYTIENVTYHLLHDRIPHYSYATLTNWYQNGSPLLKNRLFTHYMKRVQLNLDILDASQVIDRSCESARVYGIDFYAVLTRGSQYDVESILFRIAKPENFIMVSPNRYQVGAQRSLECTPLVMEPITQFYSSPMVVLDFQSLYPSIMIAYNYCYSTCLGRIRKSDEDSGFGVLPSFKLDNGILKLLEDKITVSPNGVMFVKPNIRKSTLAKMLIELLDTRVMVKRAMKDYKQDSGLLRLLDAKQLTLKLLANVIYGYTSASFSGRMPSAEIADSIVSTGREILQRTIELINRTEKWGARVVYGDTDSVFVYFPGKTKEEAFTLGQDIANTVTKLYPDPIKLKFEKVYHPSVLLAKKRYVGFKYEHPSETEPVLEAKGIETVRRDGTAATQKILECSLKILFRTKDMSELKTYLYGEWTKILSNRVMLKDFIISKEVRMGSYSSRGGPNGAIVAQAKKNLDVRAEPQYGERVPYVVVYRGPNARLKDKVIPPEDLLNNSALKLDAEYYIRKQIIPPLSRIFNLIGVDILSLYESMPRSIKIEAMSMVQTTEQAKHLSRIDQYYTSSHCIVCRKLTSQTLCEECSDDVGNTVFTLTTRQQLAQQKFRKILETCQNCTKINALDAMIDIEEYADIPCESLDCSVFYERLKTKKDVRITSSFNTLIENITQ